MMAQLVKEQRRFGKIENLEEYTGLKCLWLECNGLNKIENLENQLELKCLYLHENLIENIEKLQNVPKLQTLNLSNNRIKRIENIDHLEDLSSLYISHNYLSRTEDLNHLRFCQSLSLIDLSYNRIKDPEIVDIFAALLNLKSLLFLDDCPVSEKDRACAEAWAKGGLVAETEQRRKWQEEEQRRLDGSVKELLKKINGNKLKNCEGTGEETNPDKHESNKKATILHQVENVIPQDDPYLEPCKSISAENCKLLPNEKATCQEEVDCWQPQLDEIPKLVPTGSSDEQEIESVFSDTKTNTESTSLARMLRSLIHIEGAEENISTAWNEQKPFIEEL
ncbi:Dynein assembly factor 1, axonemal [Nymphon striatum]|nr:Dynein assembly factor 1, axonemal [Nymphon striatum]